MQHFLMRAFFFHRKILLFSLSLHHLMEILFCFVRACMSVNEKEKENIRIRHLQ